MNDLTPQSPTLQTPKLGLGDRIKAAVEVIRTGKAGAVNPLSQPPEDKSRAELVAELNEWWLDAREFWKPVFQKIERSMKFAAGMQHPKGYKAVDGSEPYQADIVQRHLSQKEALLYAKNPTFEARRRERLMFKVWDETQETLQGAKLMLQKMGPMLQAAEHAKQLMAHAQGGVPVTPDEVGAAQRLIAQEPPEAQGAQALIADYEAGMKQKAWEEAVGNTLRLLFENQINAQNPPFKQQCKQLITRVNTCRVGYVKLLLQRDIKSTPTATAVKGGTEEVLATMKAKLEKMSQPDYDPESGDLAELTMMAEAFVKRQQEEQAEGGEVESEGVVLDFLPATSVIVDKGCRSLRGFVGSPRICHEMLMDVEEAERDFECSLADTDAVLYTRLGEKADNDRGNKGTDAKDKPKVLIGHIYDRRSGLCYVVCDGVKDFLKEPEAPEPDWDYFFPIIPLTFRAVEVEKNDPENDVTCYPKSDVELLMPMQKEKNRSRERFVEHRESRKPGWVAVGTKWQPGDLAKLKQVRQAGEVIVLESLAPGEKIADFIQPIPAEEIDPKTYDDAMFTQDVLEVIGSQQADLGPTNDDTATQSRIAAQARLMASNSNVDDLDEFLTLMAKGMCQILMTMQESTVKKLVGEGAVWPQLSMTEMAENVWLEIQAGSSGPPNQQLDMEVAKQLIPLLMQLPGISPELLARFGARALDPRINIEDFYQKDSPSIDALNAQKSQPPPPKESLAISYKDTPPSIQRQMEQAAGFTPATEMNGTAHMASYTASRQPKVMPKPQPTATK